MPTSFSHSQVKTSSEKKWEAASEPDYHTNEDLLYPYTSMPYFGMYDLVKIPIDRGLVHHVDYWGEGKVTNLEKVRGFSRSYNVNEQFALVSKGHSKGTQIPNRIPVVSVDDSDTSSYITDGGVKTVTISTRPISKRCAADVARIVNASEGLVVAYGYSDNSDDIQNLERELVKKGLYYGVGYELPADLKTQTEFSTKRVFADATSINNHLYNLVTGGDYINAVKIVSSLVNNQGYGVCRDFVSRLVSQGIKNAMSFAYKLWHEGHKDIVVDYFPSEFQLILDQKRIKLIGKHYNQALKLDANVDWYNDRLTWGDGKDYTSYRVSWRLISLWENNNVIFKIQNTEHNMYLKLDVNVDSYGDRKTWGSNDSSEKRHTWFLYPVKVGDQQLFLIENREYRQGLKLDASVDWYGDRLVWGNNGVVATNPEYFGFIIQPWQ
ncbi:microvitellogenin-like [Bombyx mandarina]|uniref:Microvitellogenin-like n=1 Tax=Bombyx mandarina TaxID=7092 RepID=A0A6J2JPK7_BOMMA|nr:microvitellogenin-like [Bombyx mandarina]